MKYGLSTTNIEQIQAVFARFPAIEKAVLYGSRAKGNFKPGSDIDLTLFGNALTPELSANVEDALDDLLLPYSIDLSVCDDIDNDKLKEHITRVGVVFYQKPTKKRGWEVKKLGEVCEIKNGRNQSKVVNPNGSYPIYGSGGIMGYADDYICNEGCTIIGRKGSINNPIYATTKFWNVDTAFGFSPFENLDSKFLYYFCLGFNFKELDKGTTLPSLTKTDLSLIKIAIPPLPEQQRIVAVLDEAFVAIAKAKANTERNLKNTRELFESYLQAVFENKGEDWELKTLGEVCNVIGGGTPSKANNKFYDGDIFWATVRDMKSEIIKDTEYKITNDAVKNSSTNIIPKGNVIIATRVGLGKVCLIENDTAINQDLRGIIPINPKVLSVDFLYRWLKFIAHKIVEEGTGATVQGVKLPFIKSLLIPLPSLTEQQTIVQKLNALSAETKKLEAIYQQKITDLEELKKSVLQKAFNGELPSPERA